MAIDLLTFMLTDTEQLRADLSSLSDIRPLEGVISKPHAEEMLETLSAACKNSTSSKSRSRLLVKSPVRRNSNVVVEIVPCADENGSNVIGSEAHYKEGRDLTDLTTAIGNLLLLTTAG